MYSTRIIVTLLILSITLLLGVVSFLLLHVGEENPPRETVREETYIDTTSTSPGPIVTPEETPVSQEPVSEERALGTDVNMEFPTLDE
jgi:hypothetical protein